MLLLLIIIFWFIEGTVFSLLGSDKVLASAYTDQQNFSINENLTSNYFNTSDDLSPEASSGGFLAMSFRLFTFRLPSSLFPVGLGFIISFINWVAVLMLVICIYRIANPLS